MTSTPVRSTGRFSQSRADRSIDVGTWASGSCGSHCGGEFGDAGADRVFGHLAIAEEEGRRLVASAGAVVVHGLEFDVPVTCFVCWNPLTPRQANR